MTLLPLSVPSEDPGHRSAGFSGSPVVLRLLARGDHVVALDNLGDYCDAGLKKARFARFMDLDRYTHVHAGLADRKAIGRTFRQ